MMSESTRRIGAFTDVDRAADPEFFVKYLEQTSQVPMLQAVKLRSFDLLSLQPDDALWMTLAEFITLERRCCPFLEFALTRA